MRLDPPLAASLHAVAATMAAARDPWWVIGSAAMALLGAETQVSDVDLLLSIRDADAIDARLGLGLRGDAGDDRFRSARYGRWLEPPLPVELMADLHVRQGAAWIGVRPVTRLATVIGTAMLYHPSRTEMIAILDRFGRPKDRARMALLTGTGNGGDAPSA